VFRPQALKQKAIFTTETTVNTEEKPSADCRASRNNLLIALISRHFPSVLSVPSVVNLLYLFFALLLSFSTLHGKPVLLWCPRSERDSCYGCSVWRCV
jgi:hypothetical protein